MDGLQMATILSLDPYTSKYFKGFAWKDSIKLPGNVDEARRLYILNTDVREGPGEHWCAAYYEEDVVEFFDPYVNHPAVYGFQNLLEPGRENIRARFNAACLQSLDSHVCGYHCVFYAYHRCRGFSLEKVLDLYDFADMRKNDKMVERFVLKFGRGYKLRL
jgi:hypothetical protein